MTNHFLHSGAYYDIFYRDKDYQAEFQYIQEQLQPYVKAGAQLLELGCGTGKHAEHFCRAGYSVTGIDSSPEMIEQAEQRNITGFTPVCADIASFSTPAKEYDAAFSLFHVISYLTANVQLAACFSRTFEALLPGGIFCFDCWYGPAVLHELPGTRIKKVVENGLELTRTARPVIHLDDNVVQVQYEFNITDALGSHADAVHEHHYMRYFTIPEIQWIADGAGFTLLKAVEFMTSEKTTLNTWNLFVVLQKPAASTV